MSNPERGSFHFVVDDQTYRLKLTLDGIAQLEDHYEAKYKRPFTFANILARIEAGSVSAIRALIWAALLDGHPSITVEQAGELIDKSGGVLGFASHVSSLLRSTQPAAEDLPPDGGGTRPQPAPVRSRRAGARSIGRRGASA